PRHRCRRCYRSHRRPDVDRSALSTRRGSFMFQRKHIRYVVVVGFAALALLLLLPGVAGATATHPVPPAGTCAPYKAFHSNLFGRSTRINNQFVPLTLGTQYVLGG